jgi:hypothetical protein
MPAVEGYVRGLFRATLTGAFDSAIWRGKRCIVEVRGMFGAGEDPAEGL